MGNGGPLAGPSCRGTQLLLFPWDSGLYMEGEVVALPLLPPKTQTPSTKAAMAHREAVHRPPLCQQLKPGQGQAGTLIQYKLALAWESLDWRRDDQGCVGERGVSGSPREASVGWSFLILLLGLVIWRSHTGHPRATCQVSFCCRELLSTVSGLSSDVAGLGRVTECIDQGQQTGGDLECSH